MRRSKEDGGEGWDSPCGTGKRQRRGASNDGGGQGTLEILLEHLEPLLDDDIPLYRIAYTEARTYFSGDKSLDEVIDVIQKRATLYLQEK